MDVEFDPAKDAVNIAKHGISLARAIELTEAIVVSDDRYAGERFRLYGLIDDVPHCAAVVFRGGRVRVINPRRAHRHEYDRHV